MEEAESDEQGDGEGKAIAILSPDLSIFNLPVFQRSMSQREDCANDQGKEWQRVCDVLLKGSRWQVNVKSSLAEVSGPICGGDNMIIFGSSWDSQSQDALLRVRLATPFADTALIHPFIGVTSTLQAVEAAMQGRHDAERKGFA